MASRFWVGGGSANTWAATGNTNWAATSGGAGNQTVPGTGDIAVFDGGSGSGNSVIGANITVQGLECDGSTLGTGTYAGTITHNTSVTLTINTGAANSLRFASGMTYTPASTTAIITLTHTTGTANIKSYGKALAALTINGVGGTTQTLDALKVNAVANSVLTLTNGIIDFNGGAGGPYALTAHTVVATNNATRSLILGGDVTLGGSTANATIWNISNTGTLTFTKNSANIIILPPTAGGQFYTFTGAGLTYNNLTLNANTTRQVFQLGGAAGMTFGTITVNGSWTFQWTNNITITATAASFTGTPTQPTEVFMGNSTQAATLSVASGTVTASWCGLFSVIATGGATFSATNSFDFGFNTGWSITPPADATTVAPTAAQVATAVWTDITAGDFTVSASVGKSVMNGVALGTGLTINAYTGNTVQTGDSFAIVKSGGTGDNAAIKTKTDNLPAAPASTTNITGGTITTVTNLTNAPTNGDLTAAMIASVTGAVPTAAANATALLDSTNAVETGLTPRGLFRLIGAVLAGKLSGGATTTNTFRNAVADSKDRVTATVDTSGNRTAITTDTT